MSNLNLIGCIPARSGSRRLVNKNALEFCGSSLIEISVTAAIDAQSLAHVGLSTDSPEYIDLARKAGLEESYMRPASLAGPEASVADCVLHYVEWAEQRGVGSFTHVVLLQPTSPFRTSRNIDDAVTVWKDSGKPSLVSVVQAAPRPELIVRSDRRTGKLARTGGEASSDFYILDGSIFISPVEQLRVTGRFWDEESALYVSKLPRFFDIDTEFEFLMAEALFSNDLLLPAANGREVK